jgi:uncharacterized 2Fe-2S/4Fe-4S cluster protein (DUF4445 family)
MDYSVKILNLDRTIRAQKGMVLADVLQENGIDISLYCHKKAICGKCFVEILEGFLPPLDKSEEHLLQRHKRSRKHRLACRYKIAGSLVLNIPPGSLLQKTSILKTGIEMPLVIDPPVKKYFGEIKNPDLRHPHSLRSEWERLFRKKRLNFPVAVLRTLPDMLKESENKVTTAFFDEKEILAVEPGDTTGRNFGLAVDLGTTTLVVELVDMNTGRSVDMETANNSQMKFGMDIVSRISFAYRNPDNLQKLQSAVLKTLASMIESLLTRNQIPPDFVYEIVLAGNTAMNHMLLGIPVDTLAVSPFHAVFHRMPEFRAQEVGFHLNPHSKAYLVPNIKSFVGGDISAGLQATDLANRKGNQLFVDLGTNGEIVLKTDKTFMATSTAAGPAFEGMNILSGMLALPGAIYKAEKKKGLSLHTVGDEKPKGICGTGLIDLIAFFLEEEKIAPSGKISGGQDQLRVTEKIFLTQQDIREVQLAVAAVRTGIRMICERHRVEKHDLDRIFIAGAFGNYLNTQNAQKIGLLPDIDAEKIVFVGNSSLAGARALLLSKPARTRTETLIKKVGYISLATDPRFQEYFVSSLRFGEGEEAG